MNNQTDPTSDCSGGESPDTGYKQAASYSRKVDADVERDPASQARDRESKRERTSRRLAPADKTRRTHQATLVDYIARVRELLPGTLTDGKSGADARKLFADHPPRRNVWTGDDARMVVCFLFGNSTIPAFAIRLSFPTPASSDAVSLLRTYTRLYDRGIVEAPRSSRDVAVTPRITSPPLPDSRVPRP